MSASQTSVLDSRSLLRLHSIQRCVTPISRTFSAKQWQESDRRILSILAQQSALVRFKFRLLLSLLNLLSLLRFARGLNRLTPRKLDQMLSALTHSPLLPLRHGIAALIVICKAGVYSQPSVYQSLGYQQRTFSLPRANRQNSGADQV